MMAELTPFLSGISQVVNLPRGAPLAERLRLITLSHQLGVKACWLG